MTKQTHTARHLLPLHIDAEEINTRLSYLAQVRKCKKCKIPVNQAITDITNLLIQATSMYPALIAARMEAANLRAAIQATLGAAEDGEADPLGYLRDELAEPAGLVPGVGEEWCL